MKRLTTILFACCAAIAAWGYDFSATVSSGQTLYFSIVDASMKTVKVTSELDSSPYYSAFPTGDLVIPATVVNPDNSETYTITSVGANAFNGCTGLTSVEFPTAATFTSIGKYGFYKAGITSIIIPDNITSLGDNSFQETKVRS